MKTVRTKMILDSFPLPSETMVFSGVSLLKYVEVNWNDQHNARVTAWASDDAIHQAYDNTQNDYLRPAIESGDPALVGLAGAIQKVASGLNSANMQAIAGYNLQGQIVDMIERTLKIVETLAKRIKELYGDDVLAEQTLLAYMQGTLRNAEPLPAPSDTGSVPSGSTSSAASTP